MEPIIGIDLGTTNSEVAFAADGRVTVIRDADDGIVPSCVGLNDDGAVIVGIEARNQAVAAPEESMASRCSAPTRTCADRFTPMQMPADIR